MEKAKIYQVDAFTDRPFKGNPAAVCLLDEPADEKWMQNMAAEMNLSETAFVVPRDDGFGLRWFTPTVEVKLCGHATLATAHILYETGILAPDHEAVFHTRSGVLTAKRTDDGIDLNFPSDEVSPIEPPAGLSEALGLEPVYVGIGRWCVLVEADSEEAVRNAKPDFGLVAAVPYGCVCITARAAMPEFDFVSRLFAPGAGINEDPVTGSSHCMLVPFWRGRLGKDTLTAYQASARGGTLKVRVAGDRVYLTGQAVTIFSGVVG